MLKYNIASFLLQVKSNNQLWPLMPWSTLLESIPAVHVTREEAPHLPAVVSTPAMADPPHDETAAHLRGIDIATFLASWEWLCKVL